MGVIVPLVIPGVILLLLGLVFAILAFSNEEPGIGICTLTIAVVGLVMILAGMSEGVGSPKTSISAGEYSVAFVNQSGNNIALGLVIQDADKQGHLVYYMFNRAAFEGVIPEKATRLTVVESGDFKKLVLK